jgi:acetaldehyde dehydrogenase/alcohol dehydrogenase
MEAMLLWLEELKAVLDIPPSIQAWGVKEDTFIAKVDKLAVMAFDNQCTGANPRSLSSVS